MAEKTEPVNVGQALAPETPPDINYNNLIPSRKRLVERVMNTGTRKGINHDNLIEATPSRLGASSEKVYREGNSWIVLGRDRPNNRTSGYGAVGDHRASSIDICAGPQGYQITEYNSDEKSKVSVDPDFEKDSARIYISSKTDLDRNFNLPCSWPGSDLKAKSGIGLKADGIRIIGRRGIKLLAGSFGELRDSHGEIIDTYSGIDLISGNTDFDLEPLVKGKALNKALESLTDHINGLNAIVISYLNYQAKYNLAIMTHWHKSPFFGAPTEPATQLLTSGAQVLVDHSSKVLNDLKNHKINLVNWKLRFLGTSSIDYINSALNRTT